MDDPNGYCVKAVHLLSNTAGENVIYGADYFGSGGILSTECEHSFRSFSANQPLVGCFAEPFEFWTGQPRGIYALDVHTCAGENSGVSLSSMRQNLFLEMVGKETNDSDSNTETNRIFLDHLLPGHVSLEGVGHQVASNVILTDSPLTSTLFFQEIERE